jgi:membrane associated rhomboid family serine protease
MKSLIGIVYLVIGVFVALNRDYLGDIDGINGVISALLAIVLWPLVLLGVDMKIGEDDGEGRRSLVVAGAGLRYLNAVAAGIRRRLVATARTGRASSKTGS